ncbi:MAG: hypothetical protein HYY93_10660 [Planctomycetes bacterium]|nr:hypothetical protein [Planctomycetota bacterium]
MRPELEQRFCGRCGAPCRGFEEIVPSLDPPRKCANCAIDGRLGLRWAFRIAAAVSAAIFVLLTFAILMIGLATREPMNPSRLWEAQLALILLCCMDALVGFGTWQLIGLARREQEWVRYVREQDERPPREGPPLLG